MSIEIPTPTPEDKFSFGMWTVGWQAPRPVRGPDPAADGPGARPGEARRARRLRRQLPRRRPDPVRQRRRRARRRSSTGSARAWPTPAWWSPRPPPTSSPTPSSRTARFTSNDRDVRRFALRKVMRNIDLAAELGRQDLRRAGVAARAPSTGAAKDVAVALDRYQEAFNLLGAVRHRPGLRPPVRDRAQAQRAARRHPAADDRTRARLHRDPRASRVGRRQPRDRARGDGRPQRRRAATPRHCGTASSSTSTSTARTARSSTRTCASAPATSAARSGSSTRCSPVGYDGPVHFDYKPPRTEDDGRRLGRLRRPACATT